jgi:hypothetical protein
MLPLLVRVAFHFFFIARTVYDREARVFGVLRVRCGTLAVEEARAFPTDQFASVNTHGAQTRRSSLWRCITHGAYL